MRDAAGRKRIESGVSSGSGSSKRGYVVSLCDRCCRVLQFALSEHHAIDPETRKTRFKEFSSQASAPPIFQVGFLPRDLPKLVPLFELCFLFYLVLRAMLDLCVSSEAAMRARRRETKRIKDGHSESLLQGGVAEDTDARWTGLSRVFWKWVPWMSRASILNLLHHTMPTVVKKDLKLVLNRRKRLVSSSQSLSEGDPSTSQFTFNWIAPLLAYFSFLVFSFIVGFDAFFIKYRMAAQYVLSEEATTLDVLHALVFVFQVLGAVDLSLFARERILLFVFEGEDGQLSEEEEVRWIIWEALVTRKVFLEFSVMRAILIMFAFDDFDIQKMVFDDATKKDRMAERARSEDSFEQFHVNKSLAASSQGLATSSQGLAESSQGHVAPSEPHEAVASSSNGHLLHKRELRAWQTREDLEKAIETLESREETDHAKENKELQQRVHRLEETEEENRKLKQQIALEKIATRSANPKKCVIS